MNIGIDISQVVYEGTGVASYTRHLVEALLLARRAHYILFGASWGRQKQLIDFIESLPPQTFSSKHIRLPQTILEIMWNRLHWFPIEHFIGDIDVFHTSDWTEPPARHPKVTTIHDLTVYKFSEYLPHTIVNNQRQKLTWVVKETQAVIADSQSTKEDITVFLRIPQSKIHVVYLGVDEVFSPQSIDKVAWVRKKYSLKTNYFLCVGTREPRKNVSRIVKAFKKLGKKDTELIIVGNPGWGGDGPFGLQIKVLNYVPLTDLVVLYSGASAFIYPSLYEGFGLPVLEAMACGCPVVTSNRGSLAEITGGIAIVVDPESEMDIAEGLEYITKLKRSERAQLTDRGITHAHKFSWEKTAQKTYEIYSSLF